MAVFKRSTVVISAVVVALLAVVGAIAAWSMRSYPKPRYYAVEDLSRVAERRGFVLRELPRDSGPYSFRGADIWYPRGATISGAYTSNGNRINFEYPAEPDHVMVVLVLEKPNGEATHVLSEFVPQLPEKGRQTTIAEDNERENGTGAYTGDTRAATRNPAP